jgi:S-adenosylmethionine hydrolase
MAAGRIVAVVSDFGADSFYVGVMKGVVHAAVPHCNVVDVTHSIRAHDAAQGSFVLDTVFDFFPVGTVFLVVVDPGVGGDRSDLIVETGGRFIVGPDNGITTEVAARTASVSCHVIDANKIDPYRVARPTGKTFLGRDVFAPAAAALAAGVPPARIGRAAASAPVTLDLPPVETGAGRITGRGRFVDDFGNILTAITANHVRSVFGDVEPGRIVVSADGIELGALCAYYSERPAGTLLALVNAWDRVEVSVREGSAVDRFAARPPDDLVVELREHDRG